MYTVASAPAVTGSVSMQRFRLFFDSVAVITTTATWNVNFFEIDSA